MGGSSANSSFMLSGPLFIKPKPPGIWEFINLIVQLALDAAMVYFWGWKSFAYMILSTFVGGGMHPMVGHFISEHYVFNPDQETYPYYGPLNLMTWNVGYQNEHHDFPRIPGCKLHKVKEIAPEYYDNLKSYKSWSQVIYMYIMDCTMGPYSRMKRKLSTKSQPRDLTCPFFSMFSMRKMIIFGSTPLSLVCNLSLLILCLLMILFYAIL